MRHAGLKHKPPDSTAVAFGDLLAAIGERRIDAYRSICHTAHDFRHPFTQYAIRFGLRATWV